MSSTDEVTAITPSVQAEVVNLDDAAKSIIAPKATEKGWALLKTFSHHYGLNPFLKEVFVTEQDTIIVARDGYLRIAQRHPNYAGLESGTVYIRIDTGQVIRFTETGPECAVDGHWVACGVIEDPRKLQPLYSWTRVKSKDGKSDVVRYARYQEFSKPGDAWQKYPSAMLEKCSQSPALKMFCGVSGAVSAEEIGEQ